MITMDEWDRIAISTGKVYAAIEAKGNKPGDFSPAALIAAVLVHAEIMDGDEYVKHANFPVMPNG